MDIGVFSFLEGLSPWWWVAFGIALGAIEMATFSLFLIWPGLAALLMAVIVALVPTMPGEVQVATYAALSVALTFAGRALVRRYGDGGDPTTNLNDRSAQMVGRRGSVVGVAHGEVTVEIDGVRWSAQADTTPQPQEGTGVEVTGLADGKLVIRPIAAG